MKTLTIPVDDALADRLHAIAAARGQDPNRYAAAALAEAVNRDAAEESERAEARALLLGPAHRFDPGAIRAKHGLPSGRTPEQVAAAAEEAIAEMDPAIRAEMERQALL